MSDREAEDVALLARTARGDGEALGALARRHGPSVLRLARAITGDDGAAADVTQETFLAALRSAASYRAEGAPVRTWLFAIARNAARKHLRGARTAQGAERALVDLGIAAGWGAPDPERALARAEQAELIARAIASLSPADAEVLLLRDAEGLPGAEAARALGIELPALKSRLHRARLRLLEEVRMRSASLDETEREVGGLRCSEVLARLSDYVDRELATAECEAVEAHLRGCSVCERFGGRFAATVRATREALGAPPALDEALLERIRARLAAAGGRAP
ncbi:MAG: sigma-70 family RNA polymerase sigma factor [Myxococcota bacterium]